VRRSDNAGPTSNALAVYYKVAVASEPTSYAWGVSGASFTVGGVQAFTNVDTASPIDVENGQTTPSATTHATPGITTTMANTMVVTSHAYASSRTWTPPSGMTESFDRPSGANNATGMSIEGNRVLLAVAGATGVKTATAAAEADAGNTHILALKPRAVNLSISTPSGVQANDVLVAAVGFNNVGAAVTPPAGWTLVRRVNNTATTANALAVYRRVAQAGEPASHAFAIAGGTYLVGGIQAFSGVDTANPVDAENGQSTASSLNHDTPSITTSSANTMLVTAHTFASAATWTPRSGQTEGFERMSATKAAATGQAITGGYQLLAAAGASGTRRATASANADVGNTHILALRRLVPNAPPVVSMTSPANGASFTAPASITLTATASDADGTIQKVEFFHGGIHLIATVTAPPYTFAWTNVSAATYSLTARATDNLNGITTSAPVDITVTAQAALYFIHPDHLNTPRVITNAAQQVVWRWDNDDPFGANMANENPSGLGSFTCNLRFPGQYFDKESNLHYNYFRDYSPEIGRYVEADPIGLRGGVNTYAYVDNDPLQWADPLGLAKFCCRLLNSFAGSVLRQQHCYVVADDGTVYGLYPRNSVGNDVGVPRTNDPRDVGGDCFDCPAINCDQNKCLTDANNAYPTGDYATLGTNSNTYAGTLARSCCRGGVPTGVSNAPGITNRPSHLSGRFQNKNIWLSMGCWSTFRIASATS
jgi:RHS repeat-associated protein